MNVELVWALPVNSSLPLARRVCESVALRVPNLMLSLTRDAILRRAFSRQVSAFFSINPLEKRIDQEIATEDATRKDRC